MNDGPRPWAGRGKPWGAPAMILGCSLGSFLLAALAVVLLSVLRAG